MNVSCPNCGATYRVDPDKVPSGGVRARCTRCGDVMQVGGGAGGGGPAGTPEPGSGAVAARRPAPPAESAAAPARPEAGDVRGAPAAAPGEGEPGHREPAAQAPPRAPSGQAAQQPVRPAASAPPAAAPPRPRPAPAFGSADPDAKARRLARALISDIVVYHPERRDRSLEAGTLRQEFREEIQKSWEEYVAQIGDAAARGTPHFREALNEILAGGRPVF